MARDILKKKAARKAYYATHREEECANARTYRASNPERARAIDRRSKANRRERIGAYNTEYKLSHREEARAYNKAYYAKHSDKQRARAKVVGPVWRAANPERVKAYPRLEHARCAASVRNKKKYADGPERFKEYVARRRALKRATQVEKINYKQILKNANGVCGICKKPFDLFGIDFDHIVPLKVGGPHVAANLQATHARCNRAKGAKVG